jgi:predicted metal-dependent HD superfamily phosphohydrolase
MSVDFDAAWHEALGVKPTRLTRGTLRRLLRRHAEPQRYYHTQAHLERMFEIFLAHREKFKHPRDSQLMMLYHDAIYEPENRDNELQSAHLSRVQLGSWLIESRLQRIERWILATKEHQASADEDSDDLKMLLDIDLAILAAPSEQYQQYAEQVAQEYAMFSPKIFNQGRQKALNGLLARPKIFYTQILGEDAEWQARMNIQAELQQLKQQSRRLDED